MKKMNKKGFTLVEIMIVVAIIGLLAAIGIPSFSKARSNSITKSKENNARIVNAAVEEYALDAGLESGTIYPADYQGFIKGAADGSLDVGSQVATLPSVTLGEEVKPADLY